MKQRKRRRTMRPPIQVNEIQNTPNYVNKRKTIERKLCVNGACSVHPCENTPTSFNNNDKGEHLICTQGGLQVSYTGPGQDEKDASLIRTDLPIPTNGIAIYYFEITVKEKGDRGRVGIGLCLKKTDLKKMPGWEDGSYGYHGDDGLLFTQNGLSGQPYGPEYGTNDVIGCCWDLINNVVFFTLNGENLGVAVKNLKGKFYPTVGLQSNGAKIIANFGNNNPPSNASNVINNVLNSSSNTSHVNFKFDIESYTNKQRQSILNQILNQNLNDDYKLLSNTILSYLMHNGYSRTATAFAKDTNNESLFKKEKELLMNKRQAICNKVIKGDIDGAISDVKQQFPQVLKQHLNVSFFLHTQKFIEMIVSGCSPEETVEYGLENLLIFRNPEFIKKAEAQDRKVTGGGIELVDDNDIDIDIANNDSDNHNNNINEEENGQNDSSNININKDDDEDDDDDDGDGKGNEKSGDGKSKRKCKQTAEKRTSYSETLKDVYLLLAYGDPANSPTGYLTKQDRREMVADRLNSAILATQGRPMRSVVERFICQSRNVLNQLRALGNGPAALISEEDFL